jgi:antitoxin component of MazEF toxin-antitoxin module
MKIGKLCTIGDSAGIVIPRANLEVLGWFKGDQLTQSIEGGALVVRNLTQRTVRPVRTRKEFGDGRLRGSQRAV